MGDDNNSTFQIKGKHHVTNYNESAGKSEAGPSSSNTNTRRRDPETFEYEPVPSKRNRIARKLVQKMRHIIYEYSVKTGEQITGVFVDKPNAPNRDYKIYGTKPLVGIMDDLKCSIDEKFQKTLDNENIPISCATIINPKLPPLTIDGVVTKLEYFTQSQLRKFIPHMIKYSANRHYTGWNNPSLKPEWWPNDLPWFNVRYDIRTTEQKEKEKWTYTLQRIIKECYKYYECEEMLLGQEILTLTLPNDQTIQENSNNCIASTSADHANEEMEVIGPVLIENVPVYNNFEILNGSSSLEFTQTSTHLDNNNVMYLLETIGPSTSLLHPIHVVPIQVMNSEDINSTINVNDLVDNLNETSNEITIKHLNDIEADDSNSKIVSTNNETS